MDPRLLQCRNEADYPQSTHVGTLTERKDLISHLPILVAGLKVAVVDPVPTTRATASKALGSLIEKLGEDAFPDLIPSLMSSLRTDTGASDRLGSAQALSEVLAGLGTGRLEETLPSILQNVASARATVREGFMTLFIFLPACFGNSFATVSSWIEPGAHFDWTSTVNTATIPHEFVIFKTDDPADHLPLEGGERL